jgi:hypothetical protein
MPTSISRLLVLGLLAGAVSRAHAEEKANPQAIIQKAIQALGGEEKLAKYKSSISKGKCKFYAMGQAIDCTAQWWIQPPRQLKAVYHMHVRGKNVTREEVITKDAGWLSMNGQVRPLTGDQLAEIHEGMETEKMANLLALKNPEYQISSVGETVVADRPAIGLKVTHPGHRDVLLYFDKQEGYLVKMQTRSKAMGREVEDETVYSDYRDYHGIRNAAKTTTKRDGKLFLECEFTQFKPVEQIPESTFAKPRSTEGKKESAAASNR